jgi:YL1 nuclear protein/YL1 nuclear protein C-terminal domain
MTSLVGNAQEEDDAFWGHETWADDDSGNESFRDSDQDSAHRKDEFDSDFNDSETDNEDEERAAGADKERELLRQERSNRQGKSNYTDVAKAGRGMMQKPRRAFGNGMNAGLVLNVPPSMVSNSAVSTTSIPGSGSGSAMPIQTLAAAATGSSLPPVPLSPPAKRPRLTSERGVNATLASARQRRSQSKKRDSRNTMPTYSETASQQSNKRPRSHVGLTKKEKRRQYFQEELLLEAVKETEPDNHRWLLARKRVQESADQDKDAMAALRDKHRGKNVIQKYHSRRGCLITLTFPEMDAVPELLTRKSEPPKIPERLVCIITGKPARYRDPKTGKGYFDSAAFQELRRRHEAGISLDQRPKSKQKPKPKEEDTSSLNGASSSKGEAMPPATAILSPKPSGFVLDLGGEKRSPGSARSSGRKWKPSEKMLEGMGINKEGGVPSQSEKVDEAMLADAPGLPQITCSSEKVWKASTSATTLALAVKASTSSESQALAQSGGLCPGPIATTAPVINEKPTTSTHQIAAATGKSKTVEATSTKAATAVAPNRPHVSVPTPSEPVYIIPGGDDYDSPEPRYVTQSELIMQAISNYNRSTMGQNKSNNQHT